MKEVYKFTRPIIKNGKADYVKYLEEIVRRPKLYSWKVTKLHGISMTLQKLREKGLVKYKNSSFRITNNGLLYLGAVNSGAKVSKEILKGFLK